MSLIRRVKSFTVKKSKSTDELKLTESEDNDVMVKMRFVNRYKPKRNLNKQKSFSEEVIPLRIDIEKNDLFQRQRLKHEYMESGDDSNFKKQSQSKGTIIKGANNSFIKRRESQSLDENNFPMCFSGSYYSNDSCSSSSVQLRQNRMTSDRIMKDRSRYNTVDVCKDLINDVSEDPKDATTTNNITKPRHFPVCKIDNDEDQVQIRATINREIARPKTYGSPLPSKKPDTAFEFTSPCKVEIGSDKCMEIKIGAKMTLTQNQVNILDPETNNVKLKITKKSVKYITKKELELIDSDTTIYRFRFKSTKEAKGFADEIGKSRSGGAWNQLLRLLKKRSSRDLLESKGILKNEPIFGNLATETHSAVPEIVAKLVTLIEQPENITSVGLYRTSGNLAIIQHIRYEINCGKWDVLDKYAKDVDVLTGTLKLFFRELKEPLIPHEVYQRLRPLAFGNSEDQEIVKTINQCPEPNKATLLYIIEHLLKVCSYKQDNKMDLHNISICWAPSLTVYTTTSCTDIVSQATECTTVIERILECYSKTKPDVKHNDHLYQIEKKIISLIELHLDTEGIYRKSGSNTKIDHILKLIATKDTAACLAEIDKYQGDVHDLCCTLKKYLGSLKEPLVPTELFDRYCEICDNEDEVRQMVQDMINTLPRKDVLLLLMQHLHKVLQHEHTNKMSLILLTDIWITTLTSRNANMQRVYKKKTHKFPKLFQILIGLGEQQLLPDLVQRVCHRGSRESKYDNVDCYESEVPPGNNMDTKL